MQMAMEITINNKMVINVHIGKYFCSKSEIHKKIYIWMYAIGIKNCIGYWFFDLWLRIWRVFAPFNRTRGREAMSFKFWIKFRARVFDGYFCFFMSTEAENPIRLWYLFLTLLLLLHVQKWLTVKRIKYFYANKLLNLERFSKKIGGWYWLKV